MKKGCVCLLAAATLLAPVYGQTDTSRVNPNASNEVKRIQGATAAFDEMMHAKDGGVAQDILEKAQCIGIVPNLKRAAFFVGGRYGRGIVTCRVSGTRWSAPAMIAVEGGSFGIQFGAGETDVVFAVMNRSGMNKLMQDKFAIGANVTGAIGPIGREVQAETDAMMRAEVLSWSRARGVFAGVSLEGATIHPDNDADANLYGKAIEFRAILDGHATTPAEARPLLNTLARYVPKEPKTGE